MGKGYNRSGMGRLQRSAAVGVTGPLWTTPGDALDVLLHLLPIDLHILFTATCGAIRLREISLWKERPYGHADILRNTFGGRGYQGLTI